MTYTIIPIATARSPYKQKFGVARQPGLVPAAEVCIELNPEFTADSVRGLEHFDYVWISFIFHGVLDEGWAQMVRPPRLGGKQKMGVFATKNIVENFRKSNFEYFIKESYKNIDFNKFEDDSIYTFDKDIVISENIEDQAILPEIKENIYLTD